jgi:hypothetical protein
MVTGSLVTTAYIVGTRAAQALPDLSEVVLTAEDLPPGFSNLPPSAFNLEVGEPTQGGYEIESAFAVWHEEPMQVIWGFTVLLPTKADQARADEEMSQSESWLTGVIEGVGATGAGVLQQPTLSDFRTVGDASVGLTMVFDVEGTPTRLDIFSFRRGAAGAFFYTMYADSQIPVIPIDDAAQKLDSRVVEALSSR